MNHAYCEEGMQMPHKEMQCTCCQLVLVTKLLVAPLHHIDALLPAVLPIDWNKNSSARSSYLATMQ